MPSPRRMCMLEENKLRYVNMYVQKKLPNPLPSSRIRIARLRHTKTLDIRRHWNFQEAEHDE